MDTVSIIVPIYKVEKYLRECLDSIINQTYSKLQIILVDDGSPDKCGDICDEYSKNDSRIVVLHCENGGLSVARNRGLSVCEGEYVYFVDSDDYLKENAVEVLLKHMQKDDLDMLLYDAISFDETSKEVSKDEINKYIRQHDYSSVCSGAELFLKLLENDEYCSPVQYGFFKKDFIDAHRLLTFHEGIVHEDEEFMFLALLSAKCVKHISDVLYYHRFRSDSIMGLKTSLKNTDSCYDIIKLLVDERELFLFDVKTAYAYKVGVARLVSILFNRVRMSVDKNSKRTRQQVREIKTMLRRLWYFDSDEVKKAVLDKNHRKFSVKKIKMRLYPMISPFVKMIKKG